MKAVSMWVAAFVVVAVAAWADPPMVVHAGKVFDESFPDHPISSYTDSLGVYSVTLNRPGRVFFVKAGYDSLMLHWPDQFSGSDQGGCGITLGPVYLRRASE